MPGRQLAGFVKKILHRGSSDSVGIGYGFDIRVTRKDWKPQMPADLA